MRRLCVAAAMLVCLVPTTQIFAQTSNATLGGTVSDASRALIPGVTITAANTQTGIITTVVSNEAGAYQFASLQTGIYKVSAELPGFQTQTYSDVVLGVSQQVRLNFSLQVGGVAQAVEVTVAADTLLATSSSSVGAVLPEYKVRDLPLATRDVMDLVGTTAGTLGNMSFAGGRSSQINTTRDGLVVSDGRYLSTNGAYTSTYASPDLVEEVRVIVAQADAESGRGSGQVQMVTRSGTNQYRGSLFWLNSNSALGANSFFNNFNGASKDYQNRNQFGGRLGGPIVKNKTFFFFLYEGQRYLTRQIFTANVLTADARKGNFRFFPGVDNGNAFSSNPTVDVLGQPVTPRGAAGPLSSFSVYGRDPVRPAIDPSGFMQRLLDRMPLPNKFTVGDGLNTAGYQWVRHIEGLEDNTGTSPNTNRNQYNVRIDHSLSSNHKLSFTGTREYNCCVSTGTARVTQWPGGYSGEVSRNPDVYSVALISTLAPTVVNEFRSGLRRSHYEAHGSYTLPGKIGDEARAFLPQSNGILLMPKPTLFPEHLLTNGVNTTRYQRSPLFMYTDTVSWTRGVHAFKGGAEARFTASNGWNAEDIDAITATFGAGGVAVRGIDSANIPGLIGASQTTAQNLLTDLSGSIRQIREGFSLVDAKNPRFVDSRELKEKWRYYRDREFSAFFKDDWKVRPDLTFNLGVRYEYYGVPWEAQGIAARPTGGENALFGISRPGGALTTVELVGKNSPNPDKQIYNDDWNNFAPAAGFSWSLPWWGKDKTILRGGYGISYQGAITYITLDGAVGNLPGVNLFTVQTSANLLSLANFNLPIPKSTEKPLEPIPITDRQQAIQGYADELRNPYVQNWNLEVQRELAKNLTLEARYVGTKGTKLFGPTVLNDVNITQTGILNAFNITRAGGDAALFDQMLRGLNLGSGPINGTTVTGSQSLRNNTLFRAQIANGDVGSFASLLNTSTTVTNVGGGLVRNSGLFPENFIVVNPQFLSVTLNANPANSTYHAMTLQITKRLSQGITNQTSYTWSRSLGQTGDTGAGEGANYRDPKNRALDKGLLSFSRTHSIRSNGTWELPFGPNRRFLNNAPAFVHRLVERWQLGGIFNWTSGAPLDVNASTASITASSAGMTPNLVGDFPKSMGTVTKVDNGVVYFDGLQQITDPARANVTTLQTVQSSFSRRAIADSQGHILLVNPSPGQVGTLGRRWIEGPSQLGLDMTLSKRVRIDETREFQLRVDAINVLNKPQWGNPTLDINSLNFGRITSATGNRTFTVNARVNF